VGLKPEIRQKLKDNYLNYLPTDFDSMDSWETRTSFSSAPWMVL